MKRNFSTYGGVVLQINNNSFDTHNDYSFDQFTINVIEKGFTIYFKKKAEKRVDRKLPMTFSIDFDYFTLLKISGNFMSSDNLTIDQIGYKDKNDFDIDWLIEDENFNDDLDLIIRLVDNDYLRINAKTCVLNYQN
jgi:hypothetical protein